MSSIRKWIASKVFSPITASSDEQSTGTTTDNGLSLFRSFSRNSSPGNSSEMNRSNSQDADLADSSSETNGSYFSIIYNHYHSKFHKKRLHSEKTLIGDMYQFYYANEDLNYISSELDAFDGRKDTERCSALVNSLKLAQDRVITLIFKIMDEVGCERATREYRLKFPDELLTGEGIESLNSQIWFGAECLAAGSTISNNQAESNYLRPIATSFTTMLEQIRYDLRSCCNNLPKCPKLSKELIHRLENFDKLFTAFEYDYVKAMLQIKTAEDIENLQELTYLFSDTLTYALNKGLISKEDVDGCQPSVMIALPRLSIVRGLVQGYGSVVCKQNCDELSTILRPFHGLLLEFHEFLNNLCDDEVFLLEQLLSTNYENNDLIDSNILNDICVPLNDINMQSNMISVYNRFLKCAKKMRNLSQLESELVTKSNLVKSPMSKYISASVDCLLIHNKSDSVSENHVDQSQPRSHPMIHRFGSLPNINLEYRKSELLYSHKLTDHSRKAMSVSGGQANVASSNSSSKGSSPSSAAYSSTNSSFGSTSSNSYPTISLVSSSSSSSMSMELDFLKQFKDMLKRTQLKSTSRSNFNRTRPTSTNYRETGAFDEITVDHRSSRRSKTAAEMHRMDSNEAEFKRYLSTPPTTSAFSNSSIRFELDTICFDDLSQLNICTKRILHQVFVMISKIADKFQTNYASELRNILRTVFLLEELSNGEIENEVHLTINHIDVQLGKFSDENEDLDKVEEGIDANEYLLHELTFEKELASTSQSSQNAECINVENHYKQTKLDNCDTNEIEGNSFQLYRSKSLENAYTAGDEVLDQSRPDTIDASPLVSNGISISSSYPREVPLVSNWQQPVSNNSKGNMKSLPSMLDGSESELSLSDHHGPQANKSTSSSNSSFSSPHIPHEVASQLTFSTGTTIDEPNCDLPSFMIPASMDADSSSMFAASMVPILGSMSGPSSSTATTLLLPPIWIPDELANTCRSCCQMFNLIRRRHHCRRCGQIFCNQCSNNFVSLKCFGYAKPVRVCNDCLVLHRQSEQLEQPMSTRTPYGAS